MTVTDKYKSKPKTKSLPEHHYKLDEQEDE